MRDMDENVVECEAAERDGGCGGAPHSLAVLRDVQRAHEERLGRVARAGGANVLQKQVQLLQSWVSDLVAQNTLLARTVEDLETEITSHLLLERRRQAEAAGEARAEAAALRARLARKDADLRGLLEVLRRLRDPRPPARASFDGIHFNEKCKKTSDKLNEIKLVNESLQKENVNKDREIRRLNKDAQQYEQTIMALRNELSLINFHTPDVSKVDAEVTADICCPGIQIGDVEPVKDYTVMLLKESAMYQDNIQQLDLSLKSSAEKVRSLREENVSLSKDVQQWRRVCAALEERARALALRGQFKDEIVREMRRQLRRAKGKLKEALEPSGLKASRDTSSNVEVGRNSVSYDSLTISCVRQQPRRTPRLPAADLSQWSPGSPRSPRSNTFRHSDDEGSIAE